MCGVHWDYVDQCYQELNESAGDGIMWIIWLFSELSGVSKFSQVAVSVLPRMIALNSMVVRMLTTEA